MWERLGLSLAECRIYGYIYGLSTSNRTEQKGYKGSERALAEKLGLSRTSVNDTLRLLQQKNLITCVNKVYYSVNSADNCVNSADNCVNSADKSVNSADSPVPPIIKEINKEMERNNTIARETLATQDPKPFDLFNEFLSAYGAVRKERSGHPYVPIGSYVNVARDFWDNLPAVAQRLLIRDIKSGKWYKERIDWVISDYKMPEPTNYNGYSFPMGAQMVIAIYNGKGGIYTKADAELYGMTIKKEIEP